MDFRPVFRFLPSSTTLMLKASNDAFKVAQQSRRPTTSFTVKGPEAVREEAKARILQAEGDPECWQLVLSESQLQFGQYRGQTFKWLLSHDVGYACGILVSHMQEREAGDSSQSPLAANKDALASYARLLPQMVQLIESRRMREGLVSVRAMDRTLVGFGAHAGMSLQALYESTSTECKTYKRWIKTQRCGMGSRMHTVQVYILGREKEGSAAGPSAAAPPPAAPPAQQRASQPASSVPSADDIIELSDDDELFAAAMEVDTLPSQAGPTLARPQVPAVHQPTGDAPHQPPLLLTGAQLLPKGWRKTLPEEQHEWLGRALFTTGTGKHPVLTSELRLWWTPPGARRLYTQIPSAQAFFQHRFFLWAPYRMWAYKLSCPNCKRQLTGAGLYKTVRRVLDFGGWYHMGTEYLECGGCKRKYAAWGQGIMSQLDLAHKAQFPAVLTYKLSCDKRVVGMMKARTLGNSASRLRAALLEQHTGDWLLRTLRYLSVLDQLQLPGVAPQQVTARLPTPSTSRCTCWRAW
ncbi:uncharacterized protein LOC133959255 [Platichthys flesus]|uniref:uncharacterized protein LOC133959255 n=1 Tax=Platichthys flesus TaxID=8260 RepID=UPI002DBD5CCA|nr:uncharacterized protein LOC133959255 [Platichthys flesus]